MAVLADGWQWVEPNRMTVVQKAWFSTFTFLFYGKKCCGGVFLYVLANKPEQSEAGGRHQVSPQSTYVCRVQSSVWRLPKYWPPPPPSPPSECVLPRTKGRGGHTRRAVRGWGVNILNILEDARHWIDLLQYNRSTRWAEFTNKNIGTTRIEAAVRTRQTWTWLIYVVDPLI